jgi:maltose/moltooligosaccharide transporter
MASDEKSAEGVAAATAAPLSKPEEKPLKLNVKRTMWIGVAFLGILLLWGVYDGYCANFLTFLFAEKMYGLTAAELKTAAYKEDFIQVQYLVGIIMALDNVAALFLMPLFGNISDKTHTKIGKRMPYILVGTVIAAIALPFIPLAFSYADPTSGGSVAASLTGVLVSMILVLCSMMMFRSPAVSLMPDLTPKPLRSRANGIINLMGYIGGAIPMLFTIIMPFSSYFDPDSKGYHNVWWIETPFLVASIVMLIAVGLLFFKVKENKVAAEVHDDMIRGDKLSETVDEVKDDGPLSKENKRNLLLILLAEVLWFMSFNAVGTYLSNFVWFGLNCSTKYSGYLSAVQGVMAAISFLIAGPVSEKIGRKKTIFIGLIICFVAYLAFSFVPTAAANQDIDESAKFPFWLFIVFGVCGFGSSFIHNCSFPMVVDFCNSDKIGKFTSYYYLASMGAQSITPIILGLLFKYTNAWRALPIYACVLLFLSAAVFAFVKAPLKTKYVRKKGIEAIGEADN